MKGIKDTRNELGIDVEGFKKKEFHISWDGGMKEENISGRRLWAEPFCFMGYELALYEEGKPMYYTLHDYTHQLKDINNLEVGEHLQLFHFEALNIIKRIK